MDILTNHIGYSASGPKKAVIQCVEGEKAEEFFVLDLKGNRVYTGTAVFAGGVANWNTGSYYRADFTEVTREGTYRIQVGEHYSQEFEISKCLVTMRMLNAVSYYFKAQRSSGEWLEDDRSLPFKGPREGEVDAHGGWYDATGDYGIHLSHLSHSTYHNPQQIPFSAYTFFKAHDFLTESQNEQYSMLKRRMLDEGFFGVDFLMRMRAPSGSFFRSINRSNALASVEGTRRIGFEYKRSSDQFSAVAATAGEESVGDENYEVSLRSGGGLAIAALAIAGRNYYPGAEHTQKEYIQAAKSAWAYLSENNERYTNDGKWNLVDEYCALIAATELYITTKEYDYLQKARLMAEKIYLRTTLTGSGLKRLEAAEGIPYYHAADEGMPVVALLQYAEIEPDDDKRVQAVEYAEDIMRWKLMVTDNRSNPFGYPVLESREGEQIVEKFFFPHHSTAAPWWQGDNARIASIAAACAELSFVTKDEELAVRCRRMAQDPLDWIMGLNPFDSCMIEGYGRNNIQYFFQNRYDFINCPGGIVNGITSGLTDEQGIAFVRQPTLEIDDNWRWAEQWIPHASWFIYASALKRE
ncbi:endoglucanase [Parablautia intestinalis]|uniref:Endoglucanase n=1 Tax=Parablautia intestinalis TaxID=2320100 RepID=A0A3A9API0_9FIRM|nr:glycoside hydrolase family 9 protein [Parablautia intestinalis]RKI93189.1 endoglucanase [Parablautia intestinalis]